MTWKVTAAERPSGHWRHQDRSLIVPALNGTAIAVLDGHGEDDDAIIRCSDLLPGLLAKAEWTSGPAMMRAIVERLLNETANHESGACISLAYVSDEGTVHLATLGDTFACAGIYDRENVQLKWLKPQDIEGNDDEREALKVLGANVSLGYLHSPGDAKLSLSRTLGNRVFRDQLIRYPAILSTTVPRNGFVILGTDGFFSMSQPEYMQMGWLACIAERMDAKQMIDSSFHRLRMRKDDATVVVAYRS